MFEHPKTFATLAMDPAKKKEVMDDLDAFRGGKDYYARVGKAWKRGPLAPSLSFVGVPMQIFAPWFFQAQARWVALVLSGREALPPEEEMLRAVREDSSAREAAGVPAYRTHAIPAVDRYVRH